MYDITVTNTLFINSVLFVSIGIFVNLLNDYLPSNKINNFLITLIGLIIYKIEINILYLLTNHTVVINVIFTILINLIYSIFVELILSKVKKRYKF